MSCTITKQQLKSSAEGSPRALLWLAIVFPSEQAL